MSTLFASVITDPHTKRLELAVDFEQLASRIETVKPMRRSDWRQHTNQNGLRGGWIYKTAKVAKSATIGPNALVLGRATVLEGAEVLEEAIVSGDSVIEGIVSGKARVIGKVRVGKNCVLTGDVLATGCGQLERGTHSTGTLLLPCAPRLKARSLTP